MSSDPFVAKDGRITLTAEGVRTTIRAMAYHTERDYLSGSIAEETTVGGGLSATRQFAANFSGDLQATYQDTDTEAALDQVQDHTYQTEAILRFNHRNQPDDHHLAGGRLLQPERIVGIRWLVGGAARAVPTLTLGLPDGLAKTEPIVM